MQKVRVPINSFQYGEVSDSLSMRVDTPIYSASASTIQNMVVMAEGSLIKRKGLENHINHGITYNSTYPEQSVLVPFVYDDNEQYIVSIQHQALKVYQIASSGAVISINVNITAGTDGVAVPFDREYLKEYTTAQLGDVLYICHPLFAPRLLTRTSLTTFEISTFSFDQRSDSKQTYQPYNKFHPQGTKLDPSATSGSNVVLKAFNEDGVADTDGVRQVAAVGGDGANQNLSINGALASSGTVTFTTARQITVTSAGNLSSQDFIIYGTNIDGVTIQSTADGPNNSTITIPEYFKTITRISCTTTTGSVTVSVGVNAYQPVSIFNINGSRSNASAIGQYNSSNSLGTTFRYGGNEILITTINTSEQAKGTIVDSLTTRLEVLNPFRTNSGTAIVEVSQPAHGFSGGESITVSEAVAVGGIAASNLNGARTINAIIDDNTYSFTAAGSSNASIDGGGFVKIATHAPTLDFDEQSFSAARGYPAAVVVHQNRLVFGGTIDQPDTLFFSKIGSFYNFDVGEALDNEAIVATAATGTVNSIRHLVSNRDLQIFTNSSEFYVPTFENKAITPTNLQIKKQTPYGSSFTQPVEIDGATVFVQSNGRIVREYIYTDSEQAYSASPVSSIASHMIDSPKYSTVAHSGFNQPDSYAAFTNNDGTLALFSSNRTERRASWTKLTVEGGKFSSLASIGDRMFANVYDAFNKLHLCEFVKDIGLDNYVYNPIASGALSVSGVYVQGNVLDVIIVDNIGGVQQYIGTFTVAANATVDISEHVSSIVVNGTTVNSPYVRGYAGKKFNSKIITNEIDASLGSGPVTGEVRGIGKVVLDLKDAQSLVVNNKSVSIGSKLNPNQTFFTTLNGITGKTEVKMTGFTRSPRITIEQDAPLPLQVNGLVVELIV
jgi:hypothetical protein